MEKDAKVFVAGHRGMVGSALLGRLRSSGFTDLVTKTSAELDLTDQTRVYDFFLQERPEYVFLAAAKVGGIVANDAYPAEFIYKNLQIQNNVIHSSWKAGVKKLLFFGSSCAYPRECPQPIKEEYLLNGPLEPTSEPYAIAKIAGIRMCQAYNRQYGTNFIAVIPATLYGPHDNFDPNTSHVLPALLQKFHSAKLAQKNGETEKVTVWGTGTPRREFLYVDDLVDACLFLMDHYNESEPINIGSGHHISIKDLALMIKDVVGFNGKIVFDISKPDGAPVKVLDVSKLKSLGWQVQTPLGKGLELTYEWFKNFVAAAENKKLQERRVAIK